MLYKEGEELKMATKKVKYTQRGEEIEQFVGVEGQQWWNDFAEKWEHTSIIGFEDAEYTAEQLRRFEEIKGLDLADNIATEYVVDGFVNKGLEILVLQKENENLKQILGNVLLQM